MPPSARKISFSSVNLIFAIRRMCLPPNQFINQVVKQDGGFSIRFRLQVAPEAKNYRVFVVDNQRNNSRPNRKDFGLAAQCRHIPRRGTATKRTHTVDNRANCLYSPSNGRHAAGGCGTNRIRYRPVFQPRARALTTKAASAKMP